MVIQEATLELRYIAERMRNRFSTQDRLEGRSWSPKVMEIPPGNRFLVISPHPDDDVIGCGGTITKLIDAGKEVRIVYMSIQTDIQLTTRLDEISASLKKIGVKDKVLRNDEFPSSDEADKLVTKAIAEYMPDAVFAPSPFENHDDHLTAFRSVAHAVQSARSPPMMIMYEVWGALMPNLVIPVSSVMDRKLASIKEHASQVKDIDYIRAVEGMDKYRAATSKLDGYAEAFLYLPGKDVVRMLLS